MCSIMFVLNNCSYLTTRLESPVQQSAAPHGSSTRSDAVDCSAIELVPNSFRNCFNATWLKPVEPPPQIYKTYRIYNIQNI